MIGHRASRCIAEVTYDRLAVRRKVETEIRRNGSAAAGAERRDLKGGSSVVVGAGRYLELRMGKVTYLKMKTESSSSRQAIESDLREIGIAAKKLANDAIRLGGLGFGTTFLKWVASFSAMSVSFSLPHLHDTNFSLNSEFLPFIFLIPFRMTVKSTLLKRILSCGGGAQQLVGCGIKGNGSFQSVCMKRVFAGHIFGMVSYRHGVLVKSIEIFAYLGSDKLEDKYVNFPLSPIHLPQSSCTVVQLLKVIVIQYHLFDVPLSPSEGEVGKWIAFIAIVLRLFFPRHYPGMVC
ncbi:hypothetical protein ACLOJK_041164 [Asimina triloba]